MKNFKPRIFLGGGSKYKLGHKSSRQVTARFTVILGGETYNPSKLEKMMMIGKERHYRVAGWSTGAD